MNTRIGTARLLAVSSLMLLVGAGLAQGGASTAAGPVESADLPVTRVVLFTSGIGYFEHAGTVTGTEELELDVSSEHMDDLLQSLVLQDFDGGSIRPVRYDARDPLQRILAGYSLDLSGAPTLAELLAQTRGERVHLEAGQSLDGTILSVERVAAPDEAPEIFLTVSTATGLQRVSLDEVRELRFERAELRQELEAALAAIARHRGTDDNTVRLRFAGDGSRRVRVGYVREMPVWKTSYRLVVDEKGAAELQGWAIFDNPTNIDLEEVSVSFVAGQPISFITSLYPPVYVARPRVSVSVAPTVVPPADAGGLAPTAPPVAQERFAPSEAEDAVGFMAEPEPAPRLSGVGVAAMAEGTRTGATFEYRVSEPVTIGRHESAMIPIVQQRVEAQLVSIYDPSVLAVHPLRGVRLVNDTGLHLAAGPVSVFGSGGFTGNARIGDIVPGESRLLSYAVDLDVEVQQTGSSEPERITAVTLRNGLIETTFRQRIVTTYRVESGEDQARFLIVEHPRRSGFEVVSPETAPVETREGYRFGVAIVGEDASEDEEPGDSAVPTHARCPAGAGCTLEVVMERTDLRRLAISNVTTDQLAFYLENVELTEEDRAVLAQILELYRQIGEVDRSISERQARLDAIHREQSRIRQNMAELERNSSLYRRYLSDLETQENELDSLQLNIEELRDQRLELQRDLDSLIGALAPNSTR